MRVGIPLAALAYAGTDAARCEAAAAEPYRPRVALPPPLPEHRLLMMRALDALADELLTMLRAVYLVSDGACIKLRGSKRRHCKSPAASPYALIINAGLLLLHVSGLRASCSPSCGWPHYSSQLATFCPSVLR